MTKHGTARLRWIRDQLDLSADELAATVERLPPAWREGVGADLERLVSDARVLTRSVDRALQAQEHGSTRRSARARTRRPGSIEARTTLRG